jgi:hypothetical protein
VEKGQATDVMDREYDIGRFAILFTLPMGHFHREAEDIHNRSFKVMSRE